MSMTLVVWAMLSIVAITIARGVDKLSEIRDVLREIARNQSSSKEGMEQ